MIFPVSFFFILLGIRCIIHNIMCPPPKKKESYFQRLQNSVQKNKIKLEKIKCICFKQQFPKPTRAGNV